MRSRPGLRFPGGAAAQPERDAGDIHEQEDDRCGVRKGVSMAGGRRFQVYRQGRYEHGAHRQGQQSNKHARSLWAESLDPVPRPPAKEGDPQYEQYVGQDRAGQGRLHDGREPLSQCEYRYEQLGQVPRLDCKRPVVPGPRYSPIWSIDYYRAVRVGWGSG